MKFSESWLREWVNPEVTTEKLLEQLTMAGLEVDGVEAAAPAFEKVVVAEVISVEPHPDADRLRVTRVEAGEEEPLTIVTNVADIAVGEKIAVAKVGCVLPDGMKIKKAKLRGVPSFGMFCSMGTLGLMEESESLERLPSEAPVGVSIRDYMALDDQVIEVDLTPNRGDCLSISGVAREVGVMNSASVKSVEFEPVIASSERTFPVYIENAAGCPRYLSRVIEGVNPRADSPLWMQERLRRAGMRSLGPLVDVTNYVMLELGQPMHAFDLAKLSGAITVRNAVAGESLTLLDGKEIELNRETLLVTDEKGPLALAGIMGGESSGIEEETTDLFLECAFFAPLSIAGKARSYGLHTDSSHRFERGVDSQLQLLAIERATQLLIDIVGGSAGPVEEAVNPETLPSANRINLRSERLERILGLSLDPAWVAETLQGLGLSLETNAEGWQVVSPSWRFDLAIEADLIEEVGRIYGYDQLPSTHPQLSAEIRKNPEAITPLQQLRQTLVDQGYREVITYSFVDPKLQQIMDPQHEALALENPISSDLSVMRTSLWPGLIQSMEFNSKRQQSQIRLFETGLRFVPEADGLKQQRMVAGLLYGEIEPEQWSVTSRSVDFFDMKGDLELLLEKGDKVQFVAASHPVLHPGKSAQIKMGATVLGWAGAIHPAIAAQLSLPKNIFLFELDLQQLQERMIPAFNPLSKFPMIRRDLAILLNRNILSQEVLDTAEASIDQKILRGVRLFDLYQGDNLKEDEKSLAFGIFLQHDERTLTDDEVEAVIVQVVENLEQQHGAKLRI
ncbi:MAG: phenylalanine--tRNA ligase subunit beta [Gammaproteobacteria bacterium]|jgi:phenylalanyl-tRNA synthetase beta chain|nr:phenylalanine--tRNA ligase subunit beta [Gammaproteobacteria bacterium]MBT3488507.1 phenylalanine--tRNA ligase subunit beta [Gammaproteobacteria bacterium]MBT3719987.1 phenylalanine--tRNA ligase subunit beta [Gammaproteobacteria bacterium]MBT3845200.1 phenylalanine--tRNA ligase subunit beta [Gammaproteobacteria bacterium]MBT3893400.1 phenylalanine--tRNA ligase subunit beta [Gammaproteobacteria bacterium]